MEKLIKRLERVIAIGAPDKDGMHPISAEAVLEVVKGLSEHSTNLAEVGTDTISRQVAISAICSACGKIDCDKMDKCEKLQLPPVNSSEIPNSSDTISRQMAIEALDEQIEQCDKALSSFDISMSDEFAVKVERASLVAFRETLEYLPSAQPDIIRCRNCKFASGDSRICMKFGHSPIGELDFCSFAERREVTE